MIFLSSFLEVARCPSFRPRFFFTAVKLAAACEIAAKLGLFLASFFFKSFWITLSFRGFYPEPGCLKA